MTQSAAERYASHADDIGVLLDLIQEELKVHASRAEKEPKNWGFAGDLGDIRLRLKGILQCLILDRFDSESEASSFIDEHLQGMREDGTT